MWRGKAGLRDTWLRIKHLPPGSALSRVVDPEQWRTEHYMAADTYDLIAVSGGVKLTGSPEPVRYERPGDREIKRAKQEAMDRKLRESRERFQRQLAAGGDFDG
jgi:hypothetical protein